MIISVRWAQVLTQSIKSGDIFNFVKIVITLTLKQDKGQQQISTLTNKTTGHMKLAK